MIKRLIVFMMGLMLMYALATPLVASATSSQIFRTIYEEDFEKVTGALHDETIFWATHGTSGVKTSDPIGGGRALHFDFSGAIGDFVSLGGTSTDAIRLVNDVYRITLDIKGRDVDFLNLKIEQSATWQVYHEFILNPLTGQRLDGDGTPMSLAANETLDFNNENQVSTVSFVFQARQNQPSYIVFDARISGVEPRVVIDNVKIERQMEAMTFRTVAVENFDNASGEVYQTSIFWLNDDEGTTGAFLNTPGVAIQNRSLVYGIHKIGWDILGGTQGQKLTMKGGHTYQISMDIRMIDVAHLAIKVRQIADDSNMYEMYFNQQGQRLPGSIPTQNPESIEIRNGIIHVQFEFNSLIDDNAYLFLEANSLAIGGQVVIDNFHVEEEMFDLPYQTFTIHEQINFENVPSGTDPLTHFKLANGASNRPYTLTDTMAIQGEHALKYASLTRFQWNELLVTDQIELRNNTYKIHMKAIFEGISNVKMSLVDTNGVIIHEMYFNTVTLKRTQTYGKAYLDQGKLFYNRGKIYIDYVFPELEADMDYVWKMAVYPTTTQAYAVLDDLTFLLALDQPLIDETIAPVPPAPEVIDQPLPSGKDDAYMIPTSIFDLSTRAPLIQGSINMTMMLVVLSLVSFASLGLGIFGIFLVFKKVPITARKIIYTSLIGILVIVIPVGMFFGCVGFRQTLDQRLNREFDHFRDYQYVYPEKVEGNLFNPGMGWVALEEPTYGGHPDMGSSGTLPEISNISLSTSWARIEVEEGVYDWTLVDQVIDYWTALGKRINFRIVTDSLMLPNTYSGTPKWLFDKYNVPYEELNYTDPGPVRTFRVVDTTNADYQRHLSLFLEAMADRYHDNDMIDVIEIRGWGNWGEWHSGFTYPTMESRIHALQDIIDRYVDAFKETNKLLVLSSAWDPYHMPYNSYEDYYTFSAFDYLLRLENTTFRRDSGGHLLNYPTDERLMSDVFRSGKRLPLLGEYASSIHHAYNETYGFDLIGGLDDILFKMRPNYSTVLGWVNANVAQVVDDGNSILWDRGNEKLGYRLSVDVARFPYRAKQNTEMDIMLSFSNTAVGRFWYKHPLKISLLDENMQTVHHVIDQNFDARTFVLGEVNHFYTKLDIPADLPSGAYHLAVAIVDDQGNPSIRMGMAGEIDDTKVYALGTIDIASTHQTPGPVYEHLSYEQARQYAFKPHTTYAITFDYTPHFRLSDYHFSDTNGYVFALTSQRGGDGATVGYHKWQDVSGERGMKTIYVTTHGHNDYTLNINSEGYSPIDIHHVNIEVVNGYYEHFENYDFTKLDALYLPVSTTLASLTKDKNIMGSESILITSSRRGNTEAFKFDTDVYALEPNSSYTISFQFESTSLVGKGGYMFINLINEVTNTRTRVGEWYERTDRGVTMKTFQFTTGDSPKQTLAFGMRHDGEYVIDDVNLIKHPSGNIIAGESYGHPKNVRPDLDIAGIGDVEGFEALSFNETAFEWGQFGWGQITYDPKYVISGNSSLMGQIEMEALDNEWFEFARSRTSSLPLKPNTTYEVTFSYRILKNPVNNGFFYVLMRDQLAGLPSDVGFIIIPAATQSDLMTVKTMTIEIHTGNYMYYQFIFGMHMLGEIVIDDVIFIEK